MLLTLVPAMGVTASAAEDRSYTEAEIRDYDTFEIGRASCRERV